MVEEVNKRIQILTEFVFRGQQQLNAIRGQLKQLANDKNYVPTRAEETFASLGKSVRTASFSLRGLGQVLGGVVGSFFGPQGAIIGATAGATSFGLLGKTLGFAVKGMQSLKNLVFGFKPQFLSLLFLSMGINRVFNGMIKTVTDLFGVNEYFQAVIITLLIDALYPLIETLYQIFDWFLNLPDPIKKAIGQFIIAAAAATGLVYVFSQLILAFTSFGVIGSFIAILSPFAAILFGAAVAVRQFGENAIGMANNLATLISKGVKWVVGLIQNMTKFVTENQTLIMQVASTIMTSLINGLISILTALSPFVTKFFEMLRALYAENRDKIRLIAGTIIGWIIQFLTIFLPDITHYAISFISALVDGIRNNKEQIKGVMKEVIDLMADTLDSLMPEIVNVAIELGGAFARAFIKSAAPAIARFTLNPRGLSTSEIFNRTGNPWDIQPVQDAIIGPRGNIITTSPDDYLIATKTPESLGNRGNINLSVTYNTNVSDKREFEALLKNNNIKLTDEIRRLAQV